MFVSHKVLNGRHLMKDFCRRVSGRNRYLLVEYESQTGAEADFTAYGVPLAPVTSFKYLGRILAAEGGNWTALVCNLRRAKQKWAHLTRILSR